MTLGRTFVTFEGTLRVVDPQFSLVDSATAMAHDRIRETLRPDTLREALTAEAMTQLPRLRRLPERVSEILDQASEGRFVARVSLFAERGDVETATRLLNRLVLGVLAAALGVGSVLLLAVDVGPELGRGITLDELLGYLGLVSATILSLRVIAAIIRDGMV